MSSSVKESTPAKTKTVCAAGSPGHIPVLVLMREGPGGFALVQGYSPNHIFGT